jgi:serine protease Do
LIKYIGASKVGKKVQVQILRDGKPQTIEVTIGHRPDFNKLAQPAEEKTGNTGPYEWRGLRVQSITPEIADRLNIEDVTGVVVSAVAQNSQAIEAGIRPGDVIVSVNNSPVSSPQEFADIAGPAKGSCLIRTIRGFFVIEEKTE